MIVEGHAILKLFRKLEPGIHPDVEVTRFLTIERQFVHTPVLLGTIAFEDARGNTIAGMLQELVPGAVDAWTYALAVSRAYFSGRGDSSRPAFTIDAEQLGTITRALHETLASGDRGSDFERQPVADVDLRAWTAQATEMIERATSSLRRAIAEGTIPARVVEQAKRVAEASERFTGGLQDVARAMGADRGSKTRTTGSPVRGGSRRASASSRASPRDR